jgi:hypothetical protein
MPTELGCASANSDIFSSIQQAGREKSGFKFLPPDLIFFTLITPFEKIIYIAQFSKSFASFYPPYDFTCDQVGPNRHLFSRFVLAPKNR